MNTTTCVIEDCSAPFDARGMCKAHYARWRKYGDPLHPLTRFKSPSEALRVRVKRVDECLVWTGHIDDDGYGRIRINGKVRKAHRAAWEQVNGPIPKGMTLDHACWNRACVNVNHLRLATGAENNRSLAGAKSSNKSTGVRNVYRSANGYRVQVKSGGRYYYGGTFATIEEATGSAETLRAELFGAFAGNTREKRS